jgi:membrane protein
VSFFVVMLLFAMIFKFLPDTTVAWRDVWIGAALTAILFTVGKLLIGLYLGKSSVGSAYGAAGSLVVLLVWIYYSAQILFFGAELTQVYARRHGSWSPKKTPAEANRQRASGAPPAPGAAAPAR